jgi:hypothetical protein
MKKVLLAFTAAAAAAVVLVATSQATPTPGNLLQWDPTAASTHTYGHDPVYAVDGSNDITNYWESGSAINQWFQVDMGGDFHIGHFTIWWDSTHYATGYTITASNDGVNWHNVSYSKTGSIYQQQVTVNTDARFWRINMVGRYYAAQTYRIHELEGFTN